MFKRFAFSQLFTISVIADITPADERNQYLSRLDAVVSAAFIVGPALGGILGQVNNKFPLFFAGVVSGLALIVAFIFLKESNPTVLERWESKKNPRPAESKDTIDCSVKEQDDVSPPNDLSVKVEEDSASEQMPSAKKEKPHITKTMILCFIFEFCIRWTVNAFDSRYGIFLEDKFNINSATFSFVLFS